jgi:hypothetical protein
VAFTKQPRPFKPSKLASLRDTLERCGGFPSAALPEFETLAPRDEHGQPQMIGPYTRMPSYTIPGLRAVGYRKTGNSVAPLLHVKMVLLGGLSWHEYEGEFGSVTETVEFEPRRLWIGSVNGTYSSRFSLEFGCWQTAPKLLTEAKRFLTSTAAALC